MRKWFIDIWRVPASAGDAMTQLGIGLAAGSAIIGVHGWPDTPGTWLALGAAVLAGWAGKTVNKT